MSSRSGVLFHQHVPNEASVHDWERINARTIVFKGTVNDVANDIKLGTTGSRVVTAAAASFA
jgi:hypothetical protein